MMHDSLEGLKKYLADRAIWVRAYLAERGENITPEELDDLAEALRPIGEIHHTLIEVSAEGAGPFRDGVGMDWP